VRPHPDARRVRRLSPFHLFEELGVGLFDERADASEHPAAPIARPGVAQFLDPRIDQASRIDRL
jgi:hypothetical protein